MGTSSFTSLSRFGVRLCHVRPSVRPRVVCRRYSVSVDSVRDDRTMTGGKAEHWVSWYEQVVGLSQVREAQAQVTQAEQSFIAHQTQRREKQVELANIQTKLRVLSAELEKVHRGEERYLVLLTQEHSVIREETRVREEAATLEEEERDRFAALSSAVRDSHEKERARTERTKYWSVIGSVVGAAIGIVGTSINNYLRMRELRGIVSNSAEGGVETRHLVTQLSTMMKSQHNQLQSFISDLRTFLGPAPDGGAVRTAVEPVSSSVKAGGSVQKVESETKAIMQVIQNQEATIQKEMKEIKDFLSTAKITDEEGKTVYIAPLVGNMLENTERNLEYRMKINSLWTVTFIYGAFALTIPVLYNLFRGGS